MKLNAFLHQYKSPSFSIHCALETGFRIWENWSNTNVGLREMPNISNIYCQTERVMMIKRYEISFDKQIKRNQYKNATKKYGWEGKNNVREKTFHCEQSANRTKEWWCNLPCSTTWSALCGDWTFLIINHFNMLNNISWSLDLSLLHETDKMKIVSFYTSDSAFPLQGMQWYTFNTRKDSTLIRFQGKTPFRLTFL